MLLPTVTILTVDPKHVGNGQVMNPDFSTMNTYLINSQCPPGTICQSWSCVCTDTSKTLCKHGCYDLKSDNKNCGRCGKNV